MSIWWHHRGRSGSRVISFSAPVFPVVLCVSVFVGSILTGDWETVRALLGCFITALGVIVWWIAGLGRNDRR